MHPFRRGRPPGLPGGGWLPLKWSQGECKPGTLSGPHLGSPSGGAVAKRLRGCLSYDQSFPRGAGHPLRPAATSPQGWRQGPVGQIPKKSDSSQKESYRILLYYNYDRTSLSSTSSEPEAWLNRLSSCSTVRRFFSSPLTSTTMRPSYIITSRLP